LKKLNYFMIVKKNNISILNCKLIFSYILYILLKLINYIMIDKMKNKIWGNNILEAEDIIKSEENYKEKPYMIMQLIQVLFI